MRKHAAIAACLAILIAIATPALLAAQPKLTNEQKLKILEKMVESSGGEIKEKPDVLLSLKFKGRVGFLDDARGNTDKKEAAAVVLSPLEHGKYEVFFQVARVRQGANPTFPKFQHLFLVYEDNITEVGADHKAVWQCASSVLRVPESPGQDPPATDTPFGKLAPAEIKMPTGSLLINLTKYADEQGAPADSVPCAAVFARKLP